MGNLSAESYKALMAALVAAGEEWKRESEAGLVALREECKREAERAAAAAQAMHSTENEAEAEMQALRGEVRAK